MVEGAIKARDDSLSAHQVDQLIKNKLANDVDRFAKKRSLVDQSTASRLKRHMTTASHGL